MLSSRSVMFSVSFAAFGVLSTNALSVTNEVDIDIMDGMPLEQEDLNSEMDDFTDLFDSLDLADPVLPSRRALLTQEKFTEALGQDTAALETFVGELVKAQGQVVSDKSQFKLAMANIKEDFTNLIDLKKAIKQAGEHFGIRELAGHTAPLSEKGYKQVLAEKSETQLKIFARRLAFSVKKSIDIDAINSVMEKLQPLNKDVKFEVFKSKVNRGAEKIEGEKTLKRARKLTRTSKRAETAQQQIEDYKKISNMIIAASTTEEAFSTLSELKSEAALRSFVGLYLQKENKRIKEEEVQSYTEFLKSVLGKLETLTHNDLVSQLKDATFIA